MSAVLVQQHPHECVISVGGLMERPRVGSPEQLRELIAVLQTSLDEHDRILGG
jgi:hypothetical protein